MNYEPEKVKFILNYFRRREAFMPKRYVDFFRNVVSDIHVQEHFSDTALAADPAPLTRFEVKGRPHVIEDAAGTLHADFANRSIGGGVLQEGNVQEEILFLEKPECLCAMLFCQVTINTRVPSRS